ncbi:MAG: Transposase, IS3/IS911 family [uncultured Sphingomonadaceae bacterium]|uniref:site-specific DNA-methyltransferase (adenine-specific) n=1 Tax=uncultured Sphingomonadaceae bacterium TaxID=169976 RepID=A0A6J4RR55_9SPHN|nr:MAG: Transposase, IS3/IS911 family [uncultured Sphingomonadaceae bacterium]
MWDYAGITGGGTSRPEDLAMLPTVKPVALVTDAIRDCSKRGDIILDAFAGSGTTLIAAHKCGRTTRLMKLDPLELPPSELSISYGSLDQGDVLPVFSSSLSESFPALLNLRARSWRMKKSRYTDEQIAFALKQAETGTPVAEVIRRMGISEQTFYRWKKVYGGLGVGELRRVKQLEEENRKLKQLVADLSLDKHILQDVLAKKL